MLRSKGLLISSECQNLKSVSQELDIVELKTYKLLLSPDISRDDHLEGLELAVEPEEDDLLRVGDLGGDLRHLVLHVSAVTPEVLLGKVQCLWKADLKEHGQLIKLLH